jgi:ABC-2 type transport system ATP-binding protein
MSEASEARTGPLIEVRDLTKHYGPIRAVDGISFAVRRGDVLGFMGPNGAGKTTAMKMITGFLEPDRGDVWVAGFDVAVDPLEARRRIGYLPENAPAYGEMTVTGFLDFVADARAIEDREAVDRVVARAGLERVRFQTIETLSKGFKRRVGLAQALIHDPEVLILDEPTDGLDPNQKVVVHRLIDELAATKAIILSTHILDEVERVCNRALIISEGKILVDSTPRQLVREAPRHNVIHFELATDPTADLLVAIEEQEWCREVRSLDGGRVEVHPQAGGNHVADLLDLLEGVEVRSIHLHEGRLEDLFRRVTRGVAA